MRLRKEDFKMSIISYLYEVSLNRKMPATSVQSFSPPGGMEEHPAGNNEQAASWFLGEGCGLVYFCEKRY